MTKYFSGCHCQVIAWSLMRLYLPKPRGKAHLLTREYNHCFKGSQLLYDLISLQLGLCIVVPS